jgi:hypothetical protein
MLTAVPEPSLLATRRGKLTLPLLCAIAFLDFVDAPITNAALPSIRHALHFLAWDRASFGAVIPVDACRIAVAAGD